MNKKSIFLFSLVFINVCPAFAIDKYTLDGENYSYDFSVYNEGEKLVVSDDVTFESPYTLPQSYLGALNTAALKWASVIKSPELEDPIYYAIFSEDDYNASAISPYVAVEELPYRVTIVNAGINDLHPVDDEDDDDDDDEDDYYGFINIGYGIDKSRPGWQEYSGLHALYHGYELPDLHTTILHEFMHSLGISSDVSKQRENDENTEYFTETDDESLAIFDKDLRVYTGDNPEEFDPDCEIVPDSTMRVGKNLEFDVFTYSPYYVGEETIKVLGNKADYEDARIAIIESGGLTNYSVSYDTKGEYPQVFGLPIHNADDDDVDLSHLELHNSFMSHQMFRNWLVPMEAELAVLKDIGYDIDLRKYFGKSYYLDEMTENFTTGYSEWNGTSYTGNPSEVAQSVGMHIYGNSNNITQSSDISTVGEGSFGVRIDGINNKYTLLNGSKIKTNGKENLGIAVTWGKGHIVNVENGSSVEALGEGGIAVSFDFGNNMFGSLDDARGSYSNYYDGEVSVPTSEIDKALIKEFNVAGTLTGSKAAIYIADNAHVEEINILEGAQINGDIISEWNSVRSGANSMVLKETPEGWAYIDIDDIDDIYFTNINIDEKFSGTINGSINGKTILNNNTLRLYNEGILSIGGTQLDVFSMDNYGSIDIDTAEIAVQTGIIEGDGELNIINELQLDKDIEEIDNVINLQQNAIFSTANEKINTLSINQLNADDAHISFDLGDKFILENASQNNDASISQIVLKEEIAGILNDGVMYQMFADADKIIDFGNSHANVYYNNKKYHITQDKEEKDYLLITLAGEDVSLPDAAEDETTASYIVTEDKQTEDIGIVHGDYFEVSGKDIDVDGNKGMVVDGRFNEETNLKTGIFGASNSDLSVINDGNLEVTSQDKDITLGKQEENAVYIKNAEVKFNAGTNTINVAGAIKGADGGNNNIEVSGKETSFSRVENVNVVLRETKANLNDIAKNTLWNINDSEFNVKDDAFLSADGSNEIVGNGGTINTSNGSVSAINLKKMTINADTDADIDIDLATLSADRFVFENEDDLTVNNALLKINATSLQNQNTILTDAHINIPFIDEALNNQNLSGNVSVSGISSIFTPIFKYNLGYNEDEHSGNLVLTRGNSSRYSSYNPAIAVAPVAVLTGGYLTQLRSYDEAFHSEGGSTQPAYNQTAALPDKTLWIRPSSSFENVDLKHGPKVKDNMYDVYAGADSKTSKVLDGVDFQYGIYGGYNYSQQKYSGISIHQKGGTMGAVAHLSKNDLFNSTAISAGVDRAEAKTMYGKDKFYVFRYGIANKTGYNWHPYKNVIVQPNLLMSYTSVKAANYKNSAYVNIKSDPLYALNVAPGMMLSYGLENGWYPYIDVKMVWNIMNDTKFKANQIDLPEMSVKPYAKYGFGVLKKGYGNISGYGQVDFLSGGRSGVDITAGLQWAF